MTFQNIDLSSWDSLYKFISLRAAIIEKKKLWWRIWGEFGRFKINVRFWEWIEINFFKMYRLHEWVRSSLNCVLGSEHGRRWNYVRTATVWDFRVSCWSFVCYYDTVSYWDLICFSRNLNDLRHTLNILKLSDTLALRVVANKSKLKFVPVLN
jgi:hypothetical protein